MRLFSMGNALTQQSFAVLIFPVVVLIVSLFQLVIWLQDLTFKISSVSIADSIKLCDM